MKKNIATVILCVITLIPIGTTCKSEEKKIIGTWKTSYELKPFGIVEERYIFKKNGKCERILKMENELTNNCTYKIKEDKIRIIWNNKLDKKSYTKYSKINEKTIMIGTYKFIKVK